MPAGDFIDNRARTFGSVIHPDDHAGVIEKIDRAVQEGAPYSLEYRLVHADGTSRWITEHGRAILGVRGEKPTPNLAEFLRDYRAADAGSKPQVANAIA